MLVGLVLALQLSAAAGPARPALTARDSAALVKRVRDEEFHYLLDWRYIWQIMSREVRVTRIGPPLTNPANFDPAHPIALPGGDGCLFESNARYDVDTHDW